MNSVLLVETRGLQQYCSVAVCRAKRRKPWMPCCILFYGGKEWRWRTAAVTASGATLRTQRPAFHCTARPHVGGTRFSSRVSCSGTPLRTRMAFVRCFRIRDMVRHDCFASLHDHTTRCRAPPVSGTQTALHTLYGFCSSIAFRNCFVQPHALIAVALRWTTHDFKRGQLDLCQHRLGHWTVPIMSVRVFISQEFNPHFHSRPLLTVPLQAHLPI